MANEILETYNFVKKQIPESSDIAIILGSGLSPLAEMLSDTISIPYENIPHFPASKIDGHANELIYGMFNNKKVICMKGRFHYYSGHSLKEVTLPIKIFKKMGVQKIILTNAAGGINDSFTPGDLMLIKDHINLIGNPLIGDNDKDLGPRFPDLSEAYSKNLINIAKKSAKKLNINLKEGVYISTTGPSYETPAEINMYKILGADAVGMSTVPEVIVSRHMGIEVLAISCITNMAAGIAKKKLDHSEVTDTAARVKNDFMKLISEIISNI